MAIMRDRICLNEGSYRTYHEAEVDDDGIILHTTNILTRNLLNFEGILSLEPFMFFRDL